MRSWRLAVMCGVFLFSTIRAEIPSRVSVSDSFTSGIQIQELTEQSERSLVLLGKVWGFLKYHHPDSTSGRVNWDAELIKILPRVISSQSEKDTQSILVRWIAGLSRIAACKVCAQLDAEGLQSGPRLRWLEDTGLLGERLQGQLSSVYLNRTAGQQHYVGLQLGAGNPVFDAEDGYPDVRYPDSGYQILSVFRFWNIIEYWYPYRELLGDIWDDALAEALRTGAPAQDSVSFQRALIKLIAQVHDGHANLWSSLSVRPPAGDCQLPLNLRWVENELVVEGFSATSGYDDIQVGDVIEELAGKSTGLLIASLLPYYVGSNDSARAADVASSIGRGPCEPTELRLKGAGGVQRRAQVMRQPITSLDARSTRRNDRGGDTIQRVGSETIYLKISSVMPDDVTRLFDLAKPTDKLVIDLRGYPASAVAQEIAARLVEQTTPYVRYTLVDLTNPGAFLWSGPHSIHPAAERFAGGVAALVDETTFSGGEFTAMAIQASPGALTVGTRTAGADGNVSAIPIPGGLVTAMTGIGVFYPDKRPTQRVGIDIDVTCAPTIDGIRRGVDEVFECALRALKQTDTSSIESNN